MPEQKGKGESSEAESQPLKIAVAGASRPVFISHASQDAPLAQKVCSALETGGHSCWFAPRDVVPATLYAEGIVRALDESRVLVLVLSEHAVASAHVGKELERATSKRHPIIALKIDNALLTPAFEYFLNESQWIEVGAGGTDAAIAKLLEAVGRHLSSETPTASTQAAQAPVRKTATSRRGWGVVAAVALLALAAAYFLAGKAWLHNRAAATASIADKTIAVLPFVDLSEAKDKEYFADGMSEEIIDLLTKIPGLTVIGRTSSFEFKGKNEDVRTIGAKLNAAYVLEGSVRNSGDQLRISAQLINTKTGAHEWSETYDRRIGDVLKLQDAIAAAVVREMQLTVGSGNLERGNIHRNCRRTVVQESCR
jgi:TolB-like protein